MTCSTTCLCRCGQVACGCHAAQHRHEQAWRRDERPTGKCKCGALALMQSLRSPSNRVVTIIYCPACDTVMGRPKR